MADGWEPLVRPWLWFGATGDDVAELQYRLREVGPVSPVEVPGGDPPGVFGRATDCAVKAFQSELGLPESGIADEVVWLHLS